MGTDTIGRDCPSCEKTCASAKGLKQHHSIVHNESLVKDEVECETCGDVITLPKTRIEQADTNYCSRECRRTGDVVECDNCQEKVYKNPAQLEKHDAHFCSTDCQIEWQGRNKIEFECETCGASFKWSESRKEHYNPTYCSVKCRNNDEEWIRRASLKANLAQQRSDERTSIEKEGSTILDDIGVKYEEQVPIAEKFVVDVFVPGSELIIQWDGDYWHGHPEEEPLDDRQEQRVRVDESQNAYFQECGYSVLRFWGSDIRENPEGVAEMIEHTIERGV